VYLTCFLHDAFLVGEVVALGDPDQSVNLSCRMQFPGFAVPTARMHAGPSPRCACRSLSTSTGGEARALLGWIKGLH